MYGDVTNILAHLICSCDIVGEMPISTEAVNNDGSRIYDMSSSVTLFCYTRNITLICMYNDI